MRNDCLSLLAVALLLPTFYTNGFSISNLVPSIRTSTKLELFFAEETPNDGKSFTQVESNPIELVASDDEKFLNLAGAFLVDAFWLQSQHHQLGDTSTITPEARACLIIEQCADLQEKFGQTVGKRLFNSCVFGALDPNSKSLLGVATVKDSLLISGEILEPEKAEAMVKNAVASLGPKQRKLYKDASISTIAAQLLPPPTKAVCVLSNLAVSVEARRRGVAKTLCQEAENLASEWGYKEIHLLVEKENHAARALYEGRLGYTLVSEDESSPALRADIETGAFKEIQVHTLILSKVV